MRECEVMNGPQKGGRAQVEGSQDAGEKLLRRIGSEGPSIVICTGNPLTQLNRMWIRPLTVEPSFNVNRMSTSSLPTAFSDRSLPRVNA